MDHAKAVSRLDSLDQNQGLEENEYKTQLKQRQPQLIKLPLKLAENAKNSVLIVAEGPDAAGNGGAIKRLVEKLDPRTLRVYSTVKPTADELARIDRYASDGGTDLWKESAEL